MNIDECVERLCINMVMCFDRINDFECSCFLGYIGKICGVNIDECVS